MKSFIPVIFTILCGAIFISCTKQEVAQVVADISPVGACVANIALAVSGTEDPMQIASTCSVAVEDVYQIVSELLAHDPTVIPDAGLPLEGIEAITNKQAHLNRIIMRARALMVDGGASNERKN